MAGLFTSIHRLSSCDSRQRPLSSDVKHFGGTANALVPLHCLLFRRAFLVNAIPHFVSSVTGHPFQSPFATPPGEGLSPAWLNVLWGSTNFVFAYLLLGRVGNFEFRRWLHVVVAGAGGLAMALMLSFAFGRFYGGL